MKKSIISKTISILFLVILSLPFLPILCSMPINTMALHNFAKQVGEMPHPPNTEQISFHKNIGVYTGNGDHCDFLIFELRTYTSDNKEKIIDFYKDLDPKTYITSEYGKHRKPSILFAEDLHARGYFKEEKQWLKEAEKTTEKPLYAIEHTVYYSDGFFDIRCT